MTDWFARPVLHVTDVEASLRFYVLPARFHQPLALRARRQSTCRTGRSARLRAYLANTWPEKIGKGLVFISLNVDPQIYQAEVAALDALGAELTAKSVSVKDGSWGYRLLVVDDPDGNQLFFNYPNEDPSGKIV